MARATAKHSIGVGVADHAGSAILITVASDGTFLDRRRVELVERGVPVMPHHHDAQGLPIDEGVALVERVRRSARACASARLEELARSLSIESAVIALRVCPTLPGTVAERISEYRAQCVADWVMYRQVLAQAAQRRGWGVHWYDAKRVMSDTASALGRGRFDDLLAKTGAALGPPWQKDQRIAMAAGIAAARAPEGEAENMMKKKKRSAKREGSPAAQIDARIKELGDWRGEMLAKLRALIKKADPDVVEEWKWMGTPVWSHDGIICTGESYKKAVKMTFAKGAALKDPAGLFNSSLEGNVRRAIDFSEGDKINVKALTALIREAVALNESKPARKSKAT
jgi:hypothetical protein